MSIIFSFVIEWKFSPFASGTVISYPVRRAGADSRYSNAFSLTRAIISAETENDLTASWTIKILPVFFTDSIIVSVSSGLIVLRSISSTSISSSPGVDASCWIAAIDSWTCAP